MADQPLIDISPENWRIVRDILQRYLPDREVWAFGSRAKWTAKEFSDLDIAVIGDEPLSLAVMAELSESFQDSALPFKVDVVDWAAITPSFRKVVESTKVLLQKKAISAVLPEPTIEHGGSGWALMPLGDVITLKRGHDLPSQSRIKGTVPIVSSSGVSDFHAVAKVKGPAVITGRYGTIGQVFYSEEDCWPLNTTLYVEDFKGNDAKFVYFLLKTIDYQKYNDKAAVPGINRNHLHTAVVSVPDLATQREIANTLSSFDDRIALLRETNQTLESIAQALFKSWFVGFDPVRTKSEGREPEGVPPEVAELFPSEFEKSELGEIPKGWRAGRLGDIVSLRNERTKPSPITEQRPYVPIECISSKSIFLAESKSGKDAQSSLIKFHRGDILFGAMRPYFHKVCLAPFDGTTRTTAFVLSSRKADQTNYCLFQLFADTTIDFATNHSEGSTIPYAKWNESLEKMSVVIPPDALIEHFSSIVEPLIARGIANMEQTRELSETRDLLLPRLMSAQLKQVEADS